MGNNSPDRKNLIDILNLYILEKDTESIKKSFTKADEQLRQAETDIEILQEFLKRYKNVKGNIRSLACLIHEFNFEEIQGVGIRRNSELFQGFRNAEAPKIKSKFSFAINILFYYFSFYNMLVMNVIARNLFYTFMNW